MIVVWKRQNHGKNKRKVLRGSTQRAVVHHRDKKLFAKTKPLKIEKTKKKKKREKNNKVQ